MKWSVLCAAAIMGLVASPSFAAKHVVSAGAGAVTNDPFLRRRLLSVGYESRPEQRVSFGINLQFSPDLGDSDWKPITKQLIEENHVSPDISKLTYAGRMALTVFPVQHSEPSFMTKVGFGTSAGLVRTSESLEALDTEATDERARVTQHQLHPCFGFALTAEVWRADGFGIRMRRDMMVYIETVNATQLEMKNNGLFLIDVMRQF
jgi:hypothetical protein